MKILVGQHELKIDKKDKVNQNEYKVTKCEFEFDEAITNDLVKIALFTNSAGTYKQYIVNNECDIPAEILEKQETTTLGVYAYKEENEELELRYSPEEIKFYVSNGSYKENAENTEPITPTDKEQMEQALQNGLNDIDDKIDEVDEKLDGIDTAIEETNNLNLDVSNKVDGDVTVTLTKKDASTKTVVLSDGTSLEFNWDGTKLGIKTSDEEEYTYVDLQGIQGIPGPQGEPFRIKKTYSSVAEMNADFNNMEYGDYVMIASSVEVEDNAKLYTRGESQWIFITDFSGATGIRGPVGATPSIQIGTVVSGATPSVTRTGTDENPVLNFVLQKGDKGDKGNIGNTGNGISSIEKTSTSGLVDTYTITYTNGNTTTFDVSNGNGIDRIEKTATVGNKDTYTIYFTNGSTTTYEVANGEVTKEELEEEVDRLSMIYNLFPTTSDEDTEMTLDGTGEVKLKKIGLKGNTSQFSTTGKNLLIPRDTITYTRNGITYTYNKNTQEITFDGTCTEDNTTFLISSNQYSIIGNITTLFAYWVSGTVTNSCNLYFMDANYASRMTLDITTLTQNNPIIQRTKSAGDYIAVNNYFRFNVGSVANNLKLKLMLANSTDSTYEPYTGGIPAPNPDYPQDIQVVSGDNTIEIEGRNRFDNTITKATGQGNANAVNDTTIDTGKKLTYTGTSSQTGSFFVPYAIMDLSNYVGKTIRFKTTFTSSASSNPHISIGLCNSDGSNRDLKSTKGSNAVASFVVPELVGQQTYLLLSLYLNATGGTLNQNDYVDFTNMILTIDDEDMTYEAYTGQSHLISLGNIELCKIGDYQDYIYKNNGKWYKHKEVGKGTIDDFGNINTVTSTLANNLYGFAITIAPIKTSYNSLGSVISNVLSPKVLGSASDTTDPNNVRFNQGISKQINNTQIIITVDKSYLSTGAKTELSPFLQSVGFYFYYVSNQATDELITDTTLINQLDQIEKAYSYDTQTNISQTNADKPFILDVEAILSLKNIFNS